MRSLNFYEFGRFRESVVIRMLLRGQACHFLNRYH
jgi:hypothetical protein